MAQTPQQRRANEKFRKEQEDKMGTYRAPKADRDTRRKMAMTDQFKRNKPTVSRTWIYIFLFLLAGGILIELLRLFF